MRLNRLGYYIKDGVSSIFVHGFMSFASVCIIIACLIIMGSFSLIAVNVNEIIKQFEDENEIMAFVDESYTESQARSLESEIRSLPNVSDVEFITRQQAMNDFTGQYENKSIFDGIESDVFRDRYVVYLDDISLIEQTQQDLVSVDGIASVNAHLEIAKGFVTVRNVVGIVTIVLAAVLLIISLFIMQNTIKLATFERREEIAIMKMVGATNSFIRWPFIVEGMILGLFGALLAFLAEWGVYTLAMKKFVSTSLSALFTMLPFAQIAVPMLLFFMAIGLGVGIIGSSVAIKNYLRV